MLSSRSNMGPSIPPLSHIFSGSSTQRSDSPTHPSTSDMMGLSNRSGGGGPSGWGTTSGRWPVLPPLGTLASYGLDDPSSIPSVKTELPPLNTNGQYSGLPLSTQPYPHSVLPDVKPLSMDDRTLEHSQAGPSNPRKRSSNRPHPYHQAQKSIDNIKVEINPYISSNLIETGDISSSGEQKPRTGRAGNRRKQKYSRTRTGCLCCRARRIKCDEARPICKRCVIAKKECQYPEPNERGKNSRSSSEASDDQEEEVPARRRRAASKGKQKAEEKIAPVLQDETLGLNNILDTQTGVIDDASLNGLFDTGDLNWDESFVSGYDNPGDNASSSKNFDDIINNTQLDLAGKHQTWGNQGGGAPMLSTPNFLLPWFPTPEERSLILHYCANAADLMMAIPSGLNPMLAINLPLALDSPRGLNPSADALRVTLLGIGAIHQAFLLARSGVSTAQTAAMFQYASTLRDTGKEMVRKAALEGGGAASDAALGAATALATIDIFFGGGGWRQNFDLAKNMVAFRGGPAEMLKDSQPTMLQDGVTISPARLQLEILAIYESFGCLTTGEEPTLLSDKWDSWWFEKSRSTYEEHSVEKQFGIMVHLFSRVTRLVARAAKSPILNTEHPNASALGLDTGAQPNLGIEALTQEARQLNTDIDAWIESLQLTTLEHERVQVGNRAYAHAMKILLLRNVFQYPRDDLRVQNAAVEVMKHCSTSTALLGMSIDLTWPAIIAGCCVDGQSRQWLLTLLEGFKAQCCFDIETATRIIQEVWRRVDAGEPGADWKPVCDDLGLQVLLC